MSKVDARIPPPILMIAVAITMRVLHPCLSGSFGIEDSRRYAATAVALLAAAIFGGPAIAGFKKAGTTIDPVHVDRASSLVTEGIYYYSRNPMYVAMTALLVAWGMFLDRPILLLGPVAFACYIHWFQIRPEELAMRRRFGDAYDSYCSRTRRWL